MSPPWLRYRLRDVHPHRLREHDPLLAAQAWINTILDAVESRDTGGLARAPAAVFTDLRTVAGWLLRQADPEDFHPFGPPAEAAWQAAQARHASAFVPASSHPPMPA